MGWQGAGGGGGCWGAGSSRLPCSPAHPGVFICRGKEDALVTKNLVPGESVYGEKRVSIAVRPGPGWGCAQQRGVRGGPPSCHRRLWPPSRSLLVLLSRVSQPPVCTRPSSPPSSRPVVLGRFPRGRHSPRGLAVCPTSPLTPSHPRPPTLHTCPGLTFPSAAAAPWAGLRLLVR